MPRQTEPGAACEVLDWASSGAMSVSENLAAPRFPVLARLRRIAREFSDVTAANGSRTDLDPAALLTGRAALTGRRARGAVSAGGATRLLAARDGWFAITLARPDDVASVPAIVREPVCDDDPWKVLAKAAAMASAAEIVEQAQLLGVPAAVLGEAPPARRKPWQATRLSPTRPGRRLEDVLVADLSALWAGPLCARLLGQAGARIVKVESEHRPDGARNGPAAFYDWLHSGQRELTVDFSTRAGRTALADLLDRADIVIESARPRALRQLGLAPEERGLRPGQVWVSITGYGRTGAAANRVAFGDDAAVAGGLVAWSDGRPAFCADAIADPLTGICAALAAAKTLAAGGGQLLDVAMCRVAATFAAPADGCASPEHPAYRDSAGRWRIHCPRLDRDQPVLPPRPLGLEYRHAHS